MDHKILFTMLGYAPDTVSLGLAGDMRHDVRMQPSDIVLPEIVVSSEDPAIGIIRRAIANKQKWIDRLRSYKMQAFTRQTIYRDTAVAAINESYTKGYWQKGDTLREIVTQRRQTANVPSAFNFASVGRILNFAEERSASSDTRSSARPRTMRSSITITGSCAHARREELTCTRSG